MPRSNHDDALYPGWPSPPALDDEFRELRRLLQHCTGQIQESARDLRALQQRLEGLQRAYNRAADYAAERLLVVPLSRREMEVLRLMARDLDNATIGRELHISPGTVKNHITRILAKLAARNRREAVRRAQTLGII